MTDELWDDFDRDGIEREVWQEPEAWRNATAEQRIGALNRERVRKEAVAVLRSAFEAGTISRDDYADGCMRIARVVFGSGGDE